MRCTRLNLWFRGRRCGQFRPHRSPGVCGIWSVTHLEVVPPAQRGSGNVPPTSWRPRRGPRDASRTLPGLLRPSQPARCDAPFRGSTGRTGSSAARCSWPVPGTAPSRTRTGVSPPGTVAPPGPAPSPVPPAPPLIPPRATGGSPVASRCATSPPVRYPGSPPPASPHPRGCPSPLRAASHRPR